MGFWDEEGQLRDLWRSTRAWGSALLNSDLNTGVVAWNGNGMEIPFTLGNAAMMGLECNCVWYKVSGGGFGSVTVGRIGRKLAGENEFKTSLEFQRAITTGAPWFTYIVAFVGSRKS